MKSNQIAFIKEESSIFVITSPFQVLCTYEAIQEFKIKDYLIIAVYIKDDARTDQMFTTLDFFRLKYQKFCVYKNVSVHELLKLRCWFGRKNVKKVKRAFVGDYRNAACLELALGFLDRNGIVVYLDDGSSSINHLMGEYKFSKINRIIFGILGKIAFFRNITVGCSYYTIYSDIPSNMKVKENTLCSLRRNIMDSEQRGCYFIGTNPEVFCRVYSVTQEKYFLLLEKFLEKYRLKFPGSSLFYVFHGRDRFVDKTKLLLKNYGYTPLCLKEIVEMYIVQNRIYPQFVVGFMSSALYTIKKICPKTMVESIMIGSDKLYLNVCEYYKKHGIEISENTIPTILSSSSKSVY